MVADGNRPSISGRFGILGRFRHRASATGAHTLIYPDMLDRSHLLLLHPAASVITGANRQVSAPISLQPEHHDSQGLRDSGLIQLYVESAQEAYDTHIQAFKIAEDHRVLLPVMVCMDGYILTHVFEPVTTFDQAGGGCLFTPFDPLHYLFRAADDLGPIADETNSLEFHFLIQQAIDNARCHLRSAGFPGRPSVTTTAG
jgi:pyruvate ferredoxin oxidoreductase alpha subunit